LADSKQDNNEIISDAAKIMLEAKKEKNALHCAFCGKSQDEVKKLIAGPVVFICNECIDLCHEIILIEEIKKENGSVSDADQVNKETKLTCNYCDESHDKVFFEDTMLNMFVNNNRKFVLTGCPNNPLVRKPKIMK